MVSVLNDQLTEMILANGKVFGMFLVEVVAFCNPMSKSLVMS